MKNLPRNKRSHAAATKWCLPIAAILLACRSLAFSGTITQQYNFNGHGDGAHPYGGVIQASDGNFYGVATVGGPDAHPGSGTVFRITPAGEFTLLYAFGAPDSRGTEPMGRLAEDQSGNFYGVTFHTRPHGAGQGLIYKLSAAGDYTILHTFNGPDGGNPQSGLTLGRDGNLYGASTSVQFSIGAAYKITPDGAFTVLHHFPGANGGGFGLIGELVEGQAGTFYGVTFVGGAFGYGTIYRLQSDGELSTLYSFQGGNEGANPGSGLCLGEDGNFYGTTTSGGAFSLGTVFKFSRTRTLTILHSFNGADGENPQLTELLQANDGNFYGATPRGGSAMLGTIYRITADGAFSTIYNFSGPDGSIPQTDLAEDSFGQLHGVTTFGGSNGLGTIFSLLPSP